MSSRSVESIVGSARRIGAYQTYRKSVRPIRRRSIVLAVTLITAIAATAMPVLASSGGTKGEPQPEMYAFTVGNAGGANGSGVVLADGTLVLASASNKDNKVVVCMMHPGDRQCASTATLFPYRKGSTVDSFSGTAEVFATGGKDVSVAVEDCCYLPPFNGGAAVFDSTNDGKNFSKEIAAGNISGIGAGTVANGQLVVGTYNSGTLNVQAFAPDPKTAVSEEASPITGKPDGNTSLTTYDGGVLVASDDTSGNTLVEYAKSGSNFNKSNSYVKITTIKHEDLTGISGNALMTNPGGSLTYGERVRFFNGKSFGTWHKVPEPKGGDDGYFNLEQVGGVAHVVFLNRRHNYDVYSETTRDGVHWSGLTIYNPSTASALLVPVLNSIGSGVIYESDGTPLRAQPIMLPQSVSVTLGHSKVTVGTGTKLNGRAYPHLKNQMVTLQRLTNGRWQDWHYTVHESASGTFSFSVPGYSHTYRAVVADKPGYYQYGYSNSATLTAVPKKKK